MIASCLLLRVGYWLLVSRYRLLFVVSAEIHIVFNLCGWMLVDVRGQRCLHVVRAVFVYRDDPKSPQSLRPSSAYHDWAGQPWSSNGVWVAALVTPVAAA